MLPFWWCHLWALLEHFIWKLVDFHFSTVSCFLYFCEFMSVLTYMKSLSNLEYKSHRLRILINEKVNSDMWKCTSTHKFCLLTDEVYKHRGNKTAIKFHLKKFIISCVWYWMAWCMGFMKWEKYEQLIWWIHLKISTLRKGRKIVFALKMSGGDWPISLFKK